MLVRPAANPVLVCRAGAAAARAAAGAETPPISAAPKPASACRRLNPLRDRSAEPGEDIDVTLYDIDEPGDPVGRLVESSSDPVDGTPPRDNDVTAFDSHELEGLSPEEAAMHFVEDPDTPLAS